MKPIRIDVTPAEMLATMRGVHGLTQAKLAKLSGVPQPSIAAIESGRLGLGVERARRLAKAMRIHPSILLFPELLPSQAPRRSADFARA